MGGNKGVDWKLIGIYAGAAVLATLAVGGAIGLGALVVMAIKEANGTLW
jgi:hypothetical protein